MNCPPPARATKQAEKACPKWSSPVGLGAKRVYAGDGCVMVICHRMIAAFSRNWHKKMSNVLGLGANLPTPEKWAVVFIGGFSVAMRSFGDLNGFSHHRREVERHRR